MEVYKQSFYKNRHNQTIYSAKEILSILLDVLPNIKSGVDVGCGVGTWLSVLMQMGIKEIKGIDGNWVDKKFLEIPEERFLSIDLSQPFEIERQYDLAISLEVAEHLPPESAKDFIISLTKISDFILFSAAIPFQGGPNHINEQWQEYWTDLFNDQSYVVIDFIRCKIWENEKIPIWYRQNILFFAKKEKLSEVKIDSKKDFDSFKPISIVHPEMYLSKIKETKSVRERWRIFRWALQDWIADRLKVSR